MTRFSWLAFVGLLIFTMGTSIITPLLPLYAERFSLGNGEATLLFAVYSATVVPTMLLSGNLADRWGRKRVMLPAMACITVAALVMGFAETVPLLFLGRVLQGLAIGGFLGVGTAFVVDHALPGAKYIAAALAGVGLRVGFGLGPGLAGVVAQNVDDPLHAPWLGYAALMGVAIVAIIVTPETLTRAPRRPSPRFGIRIGVPAGQTAAFATFLAPAAFLMSFLDATLLSVVPLYMVDTLGVTNVALVGLVGFLILAMGGFAPLMLGWVQPRTAVIVGVLGSSGASLLVVGAAAVDTAMLVVLAAGLIGFINGLILMGATTICSISVPLVERGKLISALYTCAYAGTLPVVALGYLSQAIGLTAALGVSSLAALSLAAFVVLVGARNFRTVVPHPEAMGRMEELAA